MGKAKTKVFRKVTRLRNYFASIVAPLLVSEREYDGRKRYTGIRGMMPRGVCYESKDGPVGDFTITVEFTPRAAKAGAGKRSKR